MNRFYFALNAVIGAAFVSGVVWAMCAIFVSHEPSHVVAGVGLICVSAVSCTGSAMLYMIRPGFVVASVGRASVCHVRARRERAPLLSCELAGEYESIVLAMGDDTPPKVVFVEWTEPESEWPDPGI